MPSDAYAARVQKILTDIHSSSAADRTTVRAAGVLIEAAFRQTYELDLNRGGMPEVQYDTIGHLRLPLGTCQAYRDLMVLTRHPERLLPPEAEGLLGEAFE